MKNIFLYILTIIPVLTLLEDTLYNILDTQLKVPVIIEKIKSMRIIGFLKVKKKINK